MQFTLLSHDINKAKGSFPTRSTIHDNPKTSPRCTCALGLVCRQTASETKNLQFGLNIFTFGDARDAALLHQSIRNRLSSEQRAAITNIAIHQELVRHVMTGVTGSIMDLFPGLQKVFIVLRFSWKHVQDPMSFAIHAASLLRILPGQTGSCQVVPVFCKNAK
jgi:hypothetical protein